MARRITSYNVCYTKLLRLSRGAVDIGYTVVGYGNGAVVKAVFDGNDKRVIGSDAIDTGDSYNFV